MAKLDPRLIKQLKRDLKEVNDLYKQLGEEKIEVDFSTAGVEDIKLIKEYLSEAKTLTSDLNEGFGGMETSIKNIVREWKTGFADPTKAATKSFTKLQSLAQKFSDDANNISKMKGKEVSDNLKLIKIETKRLKVIELELKAKKELTAEEEAVLANLESEFKIQKEMTKEAEKRVAQEERIRKTMGLTGLGVEALTKSFQKMGMNAKFFEGIEDDMRKTADGGNKFATAWTGIKGLAIGFGNALKDPLFIIGAIVKSVKFLVGIISHVRKLTADVGMQFGLGAKEARKLTHNIEDAAFAQDGYYHTAQELVDANKEINSTTGLQLKFNQKNAEQFRNIAVYQGMGVENAKALFKIATTTTTPFAQIDDSIRDTVNTLNESTGDFVNVGDVVTTMADASADTRMSFNGNLDAMTKTAHVATRLGTSMEAIKNASRSTLDFQSSIEQEMKAEMMLGQNLNLEKLRSATLNRDIAGQAAEQERLVRQTMDAALTNQLVLEDTASALGMSADEYVAMAEAIKNNGKLQGENSKTEQINQEANQKKAVEFERSMMKLKDSFSKMFLPLAEALEPIMSGVATAISAIGKFLGTGPGKLIGKMVGLLAGGAIVFKAGKSLLSMFTGGSLFGKRGSSPMNPMYVSGDGGGGGGMDMVSNLLGKRWTKSMKWTKGLSKLVGGKNTMAGRQMRNLAAMFGKRSSFVNQMVRSNTTLSKLVPSMAQLNSKLPAGINASTKAMQAANKTSKLTQVASKAKNLLPKGVASTFAKAGPALAKTLKFLGPLGIALDLGVGGYTGYQQSKMSKEEQKAMNVEQGISSTKAVFEGVLTGGSESGSMFSESVGIEKGTVADEAMGFGGAAARGAMIGGGIGLALAPFTLGLSVPVAAGIGAVVGVVGEGFKVLTDPNSEMRKGIDQFASFAGEKISGWASTAGDAISGWASSAGSTISGWASSAGEGISNFASDAWSSVKSLDQGAKDLANEAYNYVADSAVGRGLSEVGSWFGFANGGIAPGGFKAFANGGMVSSPTMGLVGEGRYNEAIIPLPDGKSVPVQMSGGSGGGSEVAALLKELIMVVKEGGDIYMDGAKVGKSMVLSSSRLG